MKHIYIEGGQIRIIAKGKDEARIALKELRLLKKEWMLKKKDLAEEQSQIRAGYTHDVRMRGRMPRGGGFMMTIFRLFEGFNRDKERATMATKLAPLERKKDQVEQMIRNIDEEVLAVERAIAAAD